MANEGLHEDKKDISKKTRDLHRALVSLQEELEAIDWYCQRAEACDNEQLEAILLHNMHEEMEHAAMLIEWLRRSDSDLNDHLRTYMFTETPITAIEENTTNEPETTVNEGRTIGTLKE
jgi:ferritin-like protein